MKEAIGTSFVFNLMMIFVGIFIVILIGSLSYSKGFKVRNRIIDRIVEYEGYSTEARTSIESDLQAIGYKIIDANCEERNSVMPISDSDYNYCIYKYDLTRGSYYGVTVFISFDIPLIGKYINIPIYGETKVIYNKDQVIN